jgi:hypothetical protein
MRRTNADLQSPLELILEDGISAPQLPTPRGTPQLEDIFAAPTISDSLFDLLDDSLDAGYTEG